MQETEPVLTSILYRQTRAQPPPLTRPREHVRVWARMTCVSVPLHTPPKRRCARCAHVQRASWSQSLVGAVLWHDWHGYGHSRITFSKTSKRCSESKDQITRETSAAPGGSFENGMQNIFSCWKFILLHDDQQHWSKPLPMHRKGLINVYTIARILGWNPKQGVRMQLLCW